MSKLLQENGFALLQENGGFILLSSPFIQNPITRLTQWLALHKIN